MKILFRLTFLKITPYSHQTSIGELCQLALPYAYDFPPLLAKKTVGSPVSSLSHNNLFSPRFRVRLWS